MVPAVNGRVQLGGLLGEALDASRRGRLSHFIVDEASPAIALFAPAHVEQNTEGDWYGEHAGKWLVAAAKSAARAGDAALALRVQRVARHLAGLQRADGYLGTYAPSRRFTQQQPPRAPSWDGAPALRTWDVWTHTYLVLGLLEADRHFPDPHVRAAAAKIGDLGWRMFVESGVDITGLGNHHGLSATVFLDAAVELHFATGEARYLDLAKRILEQAEARAELRLLSAAAGTADASEIGTGKSYQLCWMLAGLAKLHRATGDPALLAAARRVHGNIRAHHLTQGGGPWGGVGLRSREIFNPAGFFSPEGLVETCATFAWIQLNRELLDITGEAAFAEEVERSAYNDLLGALAPDGQNWCYYSFPNGRRVHTTEWRCCKSSGAMALEELPGIAWRRQTDGVIAVNLYGPGAATFADDTAGEIHLEQATGYPFDGGIRIRVQPERLARFTLRLRIPSWAEGAEVRINGEPSAAPAAPGSYLSLDRSWTAGDEIAMSLPMRPRLHRAVNRNMQESRGPAGEPIRQEVLCVEYAAVTRGPLVYASGLVDGYRPEETIRLLADGDVLGEAPSRPGHAAGLRLQASGRPTIELEPWYAAGGRRDGTWRLTWFRISPVK